MRLSVNVLGMLSTIVLARLLTPVDFGITALAGSAYAFFAVLGQFGFDSALIHLKDPDRSHYDSAWTANIIVGVIVAICMVIIARPVANFYNDPRIEHVVYAFSLLSLAKGFENIGIVDFRKYLRFRGDFYYFVLPKVISVVVGISAAVYYRNYWALVIGMIAAQVSALTYSYLSHPFRPRLRLTHFHELFQFSRWILVGNVLSYLSKSGTEIILGRLRNPSDVGVFGIARQIALLPTEEISAPINRALFPSFATIANETDRARTAFLKVFGFTALITMPTAFGIFAIAPTLVDVILGPKWMDAAPILSVLGFVGAIEALRGACGPVLLASGIPRAVTVTLLIYIALLLPASVFLITSIGIIGVAYAMLIGSCLSTPYVFWRTIRVLNARTGQLFELTWRSITASFIMAILVAELRNWLEHDSGPSFTTLVTTVCFGAIVYAAIVSALWHFAGRPPSAEHETYSMLRSRFTRNNSS